MSQDFRIFNINNQLDFNELALKIFYYQAENVEVYKKYLYYLGIEPKSIDHVEAIPFLPIRFFKSHKVIHKNVDYEKVFLSSGTTKAIRSRHFVSSLKIYENSFLKSFETSYGNIENYTFLALLPSYLDQGESSLIYMTNELIKRANKQSKYISKIDSNTLYLLNKLASKKVILLGVSYALLDLAEKHQLDLSNWIIMETGGMKGRRKEITRDELHQILKKAFNVSSIHSEYGMTELLSQAYSKKDGYFNCPSWMRTEIREINDPFKKCRENKTGGINIIDLANIYSCSFLATDDLGKKNKKGFKVLGRFDHSDTRGCNQLTTFF